MKIALIDFYTEHCREPWQGESFALAIEKLGHVVVSEVSRDCDFSICGTIGLIDKARLAWRRFPHVPLINYNWDLYSFIWKRPIGDLDWRKYGRMLRRSREVWCPSVCTVARTHEYYGEQIQACVIKSSVWTWELNPSEIKSGDYVVSVMRKYPDKNKNLAEGVCERLGIPCHAPNHKLSHEEWRRLVGGARFLISAYAEASTGGLSLIEGHYHGKPVLMSNSPWHGGVDYFGERRGATYFQWDDAEDLTAKVRELWDNPPQLDRDECCAWVNENYSVDRMARQICERLIALCSPQAAGVQ